MDFFLGGDGLVLCFLFFLLFKDIKEKDNVLLDNWTKILV